MSEIERAREAREKGYGCADEIMNSDAAAEKYRQWSAQTREALVQDQLIERRMRAIAREEIEAALGIDAGASAVTMPATGASGFAIPGDQFNQEGGDPRSSHREVPMGPAEDKSPPAVETPAAGDCPHCDGTGLFRGGRAAVQAPKCPRCYGSGKAEDVGPRNAVEVGVAVAGYHEQMRDATIMTALARRLAEALDEMVEEMDIHLNRLPSLDSILFSRDALAEARKAGLIE